MDSSLSARVIVVREHPWRTRQGGRAAVVYTACGVEPRGSGPTWNSRAGCQSLQRPRRHALVNGFYPGGGPTALLCGRCSLRALPPAGSLLL